jgi:tetratricopeptide (TPR) repeat protein
MFAGAIAVCEGKWEQAIAHLDRVLSERPIHSEAHCWRSEALRGLGSWEEAHGAAQTACNVSKGRHLAGEINQMLARIAARGQESDAVLDSHAIASLVHALLPLAPDFTIAWEGRVKVVRALLEHALERMAGNRSVVPTVIPEDSTGAWDRFTPGESPASRARRIQERLWSQSGERVLEDLERCALEHADDAEVRLIAGDTALWMGRWELAGSHFADGLKRDPGSYEARVGAAAVGLLSGDEEASSSALLELGRGPSESPAQLLWCAEALRRTGEMESADAHLRDLMERFGTYPAAWLNRGLIRDPVVALEELNGLVPVFVSDALRAVGVRMSEATGDPARASEVLEAGLEMIRGNRVGEVLTWFVADAGMRISAWRPQRDD